MNETKIKIKKAFCKKCDYEWNTKLKYPRTPKQCPKCKASSTYNHIYVKLSNGKVIKSKYDQKK